MAKRVLVAPLDWGLGHAARCIPIIRLLVQKKCEVHIAGSGDSLVLLKKEFPFLMFHDLPGYNPQYPQKGRMVWKMAVQLRKFIQTVAREHKVTEQIVTENNIDWIISDNRYGCWSRDVYSVFVTHQSNILMPKRFGWLSYPVRIANHKYMRKFDACWIPDYPGKESLAGALVSFGQTGFHNNVRFIGPLSRFGFREPAETLYDIVAICSGPEPQRTIIENLLTEQLQDTGLRFLLVRGLFNSQQELLVNTGKKINYLTSDALQTILPAAKLVIARSGYSTVMDMQVLGKKVVFIPTPGQTEQEYLARRLKEKKIAFSMRQHEFDLKRALSESENYSGFFPSPVQDLLSQVIDDQIKDESIS